MVEIDLAQAVVRRLLQAGRCRSPHASQATTFAALQFSDPPSVQRRHLVHCLPRGHESGQFRKLESSSLTHAITFGNLAH